MRIISRLACNFNPAPDSGGWMRRRRWWVEEVRPKICEESLAIFSLALIYESGSTDSHSHKKKGYSVHFRLIGGVIVVVVVY